MVINGTKTELLLLNCHANDLRPVLLNGHICTVKSSTKSIGLIIDDNLNYKEHTNSAVAKALNSWRALKSKCAKRWGLDIPTQLYLYTTVIRPQLLYAQTIWANRNYHAIELFQNRILRSIFNHSMSPKISSCEVISGLPPIDIYCSAIDIKFLIKSVCEDDLVHKEHKLGLNRSRSLANITESKLKRYSRQHTPTSYTRASIQSYIHDIWNKRWKSPLNDTFLKTFVEDIPVDMRFSPMIHGNPYIANKITVCYG